MGVLKIYWRVMGCQNCQKIWKFARFCKNHNFQVAANQKKKLYWKVSSPFYVKCAWFCLQKHKAECLSSIICDFLVCWKWDKLQKVRNFGLKTHFWSPISFEKCFEIHICYIYLTIWAERVPEILKKNNLEIP